MTNETLIAISALLHASDTTQDQTFRDACALFHGIEDDDLLREVEDHWPQLRNYDGRGVWVGPCRNEDGWTA